MANEYFRRSEKKKGGIENTKLYEKVNIYLCIYIIFYKISKSIPK